MCTSYSYKNTLVHKIFPGRREKGEVKVPQDLARNFESVDSKAFKLTHSGPGILSLCLSENDDEDNIKLNPEYRNVEFLITTGPGPLPSKLLKELSSLNSQLSHCTSKSRLNYLLQATIASGSRPGPDSTTLNYSSAPESEAAFNPCTTLPLVSGLPRVLGLPFPPSLPQIPGLPSVPGLPQIPRLPPAPPLPQIPGTLVNVIQCLTSVVNVPGCVVEITPLLNGLDVVTSIASIPTYKPSDRIRQFNDLAEFLGDERAQNARTIWNKPLKTVYISDCGELKVAKPSLTPSLP
ncbi:hypothetical protein NC651_017516 [Populus alba x Populus x berolinensis]|nr:hypothetical protein NC651_017516 [Populus alba x Populus x berolinensis]